MILYYFIIFCVLFILYTLFDFNYILRMVFIISWRRLFYKRESIFRKFTCYGICLSPDIDIFLKHMNNARYLRELDFARFHYYDRSGIFEEIRRKGSVVTRGATSIRYRRYIPLFATYKIITRLIFWDDKRLYLSHEFVSTSNGFVHATVLSEENVNVRGRGDDVHVCDMMKIIEPNAVRPIITEELRSWLECAKEFSHKFKIIDDETDKENQEDAPFLTNSSS